MELDADNSIYHLHVIPRGAVRRSRGIQSRMDSATTLHFARNDADNQYPKLGLRFTPSQPAISAGKAPMLIIGATMRKLIHIAFGVLKSGLPFNPTLHGA